MGISFSLRKKGAGEGRPGRMGAVLATFLSMTICAIMIAGTGGCASQKPRWPAARISKPKGGYRVVLWPNTPHKPMAIYYGELVVRIYNVSHKPLPLACVASHLWGYFKLRCRVNGKRFSMDLESYASSSHRLRNVAFCWVKPGQFVQETVWIADLSGSTGLPPLHGAHHAHKAWYNKLIARHVHRVQLVAHIYGFPPFDFQGLKPMVNRHLNGWHICRSNSITFHMYNLYLPIGAGPPVVAPLSRKEWRKGRAMWNAEKRARARALMAVKAQLGKGVAGAAAGKFGIQSGAERSSYGPMLNPGGGPISRIRLPAGWRVSRMKVFRSAHGAFLLEAYRRKRDFTIMYDPDNARFRAREEQAAKHPKKGKDIIAGAGKNWEVHRTTYGFWAISRVAPIAVLGIPHRVVYTNPWRLRFIREALRSVVMAHKPASHAAGRTVPPPPR